MDAQKVLAQLDDEKSYAALSVRISRKAYDHLQEVAELTGHKPAQIMRACLEQGIEEILNIRFKGGWGLCPQNRPNQRLRPMSEPQPNRRDPQR